MLTSLKKVTALAGALAIVAMNVAPFGVNAAGLNGNTLTVSTSGGDIVIDSSATPFTPSATVVATVNGTTRVAAVTDNNTITITDADGNGGGTLDAGNYSISVVENANTPANAADDVYFSVVYNTLAAGTAGSNQVLVTARVAPTLSLAIGNGTDGNQAISFGTLTPGSFAEDDVQLTYASNAVNGVILTMTSGGLKDGAIQREIGVTDINTDDGAGANSENTAATDYYKVSTAGGTAAVTFDTATNTLANAAGAQMLATQTLVSTSAPNATTNQMVTIGTQVASDTEAGNYSDTLTFTITGSF